MREEVMAALDGLVQALEAHAEAAVSGIRPDVPDPLPQATGRLVEALERYGEVLEERTGAAVPWQVAGDRGRAPHDASDTGDDEDAPSIDDVDWAGDAERWR